MTTLDYIGFAWRGLMVLVGLALVIAVCIALIPFFILGIAAGKK